jgi:hypothetical protein
MFRRKWTTKETLDMVSRYHAEGPSQLAVMLNRSEDSISSQARRYGLRTVRRAYRRGDRSPKDKALAEQASSTRRRVCPRDELTATADYVRHFE